MSQIDASKLPERIDITEGDKTNPAWQKLERFYTNRLAQLRAQNDSDLSPEETAKLRGKIAEVKTFLALGKEKPIID